MKVIVTCRKFHDMEMGEVRPEVILPRDNETPKDALRRIWEMYYNDVLSDNLMSGGEDPVDEENCWYEDDMALLTWEDGDTVEFHIIEQITI